jgi:coproporphyrinogen III oxidase
MYQNFFEQLQSSICQQLTAVDGSKDFITDKWNRSVGSNIEEGGGITRVLEKDTIFEKAGVNFSEVRGKLPSSMSKVLTGSIEPQPFWAMGVSLVIHPYSPMVPTTHANLRYLFHPYQDSQKRVRQYL